MNIIIETVTFNLQTFNLNVKNLHKFKTTGIFKISSYGNSNMTCLILARNFLPIAIVPELYLLKLKLCLWLPDQPYVIKDLYHAFEKVHMLIRSCYTMLLLWQMILFCTHMVFLGGWGRGTGFDTQHHPFFLIFMVTGVQTILCHILSEDYINSLWWSVRWWYWQTVLL